ncbi:MAG TPA: hypothetical protein VK203_23485 [Nostocaceae cyanobacterium]|nr:hypothetical protein [Nostocaceae cyanobacterium]
MTSDLDVEEALLQLRRQEIEIDKSELMDLLLGAWVKWQKHGNMKIHIFVFLPRRKS